MGCVSLLWAAVGLLWCATPGVWQISLDLSLSSSAAAPRNSGIQREAKANAGQSETLRSSSTWPRDVNACCSGCLLPWHNPSIERALAYRQAERAGVMMELVNEINHRPWVAALTGWQCNRYKSETAPVIVCLDDWPQLLAKCVATQAGRNTPPD